MTVQSNTPPDLVQQLFAKLGAKYVIVTDASGNCEHLFLFNLDLVLTRLSDEGVIERNAWIAYVNDMNDH